VAVADRREFETISQREELHVRLRLLKSTDREIVKKWLSDPYILKLTFVVSGPDQNPSLPFSNASMEHYLDVLITDKNRMTLAILVNDHHVGNIGLKEYSKDRKTSELFIEIGEGEYRGVGVGKAAIAILLDYAFFTLQLEEMKLEVLEFNDIAIRVYDQLGFLRTHQSGRHYDENRRYWQVWGMNIRKEQWRLRRRQLFLADNLIVAPLTQL
jgi:RimJ/RimL family protein N-acetyltransferase